MREYLAVNLASGFQNTTPKTRRTDEAMLALLDVLDEIHAGELRLSLSDVEALNRALYTLARIAGERP
ncbi:hypothetical protein [Microbacterium sp. ProA8]|uniref:hypothetical protein n=1 Tax=Microbacterium chionoecetis TaxID=3153754 RepID=UPI003263FD04